MAPAVLGRIKAFCNNEPTDIPYDSGDIIGESSKYARDFTVTTEWSLFLSGSWLHTPQCQGMPSLDMTQAPSQSKCVESLLHLTESCRDERNVFIGALEKDCVRWDLSIYEGLPQDRVLITDTEDDSSPTQEDKARCGEELPSEDGGQGNAGAISEGVNKTYIASIMPKLAEDLCNPPSIGRNDSLIQGTGTGDALYWREFGLDSWNVYRDDYNRTGKPEVSVWMSIFPDSENPACNEDPTAYNIAPRTDPPGPDPLCVESMNRIQGDCEGESLGGRYSMSCAVFGWRLYETYQPDKRMFDYQWGPSSSLVKRDTVTLATWDQLQHTLGDQLHKDKECAHEVLTSAFEVKGTDWGMSLAESQANTLLHNQGCAAAVEPAEWEQKMDLVDVDPSKLYRNLRLSGRVNGEETVYESQVNVQSGALIVLQSGNSRQPEHLANAAWYYEWEHACRQEAAKDDADLTTTHNLKWIVREDLESTAESVVQELLEETGDQMRIFHVGEPEFDELCKTSNGKGVLRNLIDHRDALGSKTIKSIGVWEGERWPLMWFELGEFSGLDVLLDANSTAV